jgi:predicted nucleotidyltransferase
VENPALVTDIRPLKLLLERIIARLGPEEIWLFGSRAEGRARPDSDYDLLIVLPDASPAESLDIISAWTLVRGLDIPADIVPCTRAEFEEEKHEIDTLARAAFLRGRRIYERRA